MEIINSLSEKTKDKLPVVIIQLLISITLIAVGLYNCTVYGIDSLWVSLVLFPLGVLLPHPEPPVFTTLELGCENCDRDQVDGPTPESKRRARHFRILRVVFICHTVTCITVLLVGICCLFLLSHLQPLWVALITFSIGCLLPTPFILLQEPDCGVVRCPTLTVRSTVYS